MALIFWISLAALTYTYAVYPLGIWLLAIIRTRKIKKSPYRPSVSIVLACYNEASRLEARLKNLLESDYPNDLFEIVISIDGATDETEAIARRFESSKCRVVSRLERVGKASALNAGVRAANGEVLVFTDARQRFEPEAITHLVSNFGDESVGAVSGELFITPASSGNASEGVGLYWKYDKWIRKSEGRFDSAVGATGAIFAVRRALWRPLPDSTILDDVYTPMSIALQGYRVVFEEQARAYDVAAASAAQEFKRKARTLMGNYQLCQLMPRLMMPTYRLWAQFFSHKLMRLATPLFMMFLLASNAVLAARNANTLYLTSAGAQLVFYVSVILGSRPSGQKPKIRIFNTAYMFSVMNAAALVGLFYFIRGKRDVWVRTK